MNYYQAWWRRDIDMLMSLFSPQVEYNDFFQGCRIAPAELRDYLLACLSKSADEALRYVDRLRIDGDTALLQYQTPLSDSDNHTFLCCCEIVTVNDGRIVRINEYASLLSQHKTPQGGADRRMTIQRLGLSARQLSMMTSDIQQYFSQQRPYLNAELDMAQVASATGYTRNQISFFLNQVMGCTFYQYLNRLRLRHILALWDSDPRPPTRIEDASKAAGFHSLSTFYRCFREETGMSPKSYLQQKFSGGDF
ncbi:helix-turn-helix domain-containing protein [Brenneria izadpanahii]|uniref:Helix-turn-helix domain-containing protein n=2 Tax=Brenneria izadpanahii TaxID=2722756 RepID=A0ABX7V1F4_9GAMM|nr:helix-turn-helix domain-containing protein [Brenneria izadpanahii]